MTLVPDLVTAANFKVFVGRTQLPCAAVGPLVSRTEDGEHSCDTVTIRRGLSGRELYDWRQLVLASGQRATRDVTVEILDGPGGRAVQTFVLRDAWPCRWSGPPLDALRTEVACEEAELAFAALEWIDPDKRQETKRGRPA